MDLVVLDSSSEAGMWLAGQSCRHRVGVAHWQVRG